MGIKSNLAAILMLSVAMSSTSIAYAQPTEVSRSASQTKAGTLARLISTPDNVHALTINLVQQSGNKLFSEHTDLASLEAKYPGLKQVWIDTMIPIMLEQSDDIYPNYIEELAQLFLDNMTSSEIDTTIAFLSSPVGRRMLNSINRNLRPNAVSNEIAQKVGSDDPNISSEALKKDKAAAGNAAMKELSSSDIEVIGRFFMSPVGKKLTAVLVKKMKST